MFIKNFKSYSVVKLNMYFMKIVNGKKYQHSLANKPATKCQALCHKPYEHPPNNLSSTTITLLLLPTNIYPYFSYIFLFKFRA